MDASGRSAEWFELVPATESLQQGDFFLGVELESDRPAQDLILLTQSCDLATRGGRAPALNVLLAPCRRLADFLATRPDYISADPFEVDSLEAIRKGIVHSLYIIPPCVTSPDGRAHFTRLVHFNWMFTVPYEEAANWAKSGLRAFTFNPPYREHLGQAVARYYMRVGLPTDVAKLEPKPSGIIGSTIYRAGDVLWQDGPTLKREITVQFEKLTLQEIPDQLVLARIVDEDLQKHLSGCGEDTDQASDSLWLSLQAEYSKAQALPPRQNPPGWLRNLLELPSR